MNVEQIIPSWLLEENKLIIDSKGNRGFLEKTIKALSNIMKNEIYSEKFVNEKGYLQMIDPRVKLTTLVLLMGYCSMTKSLFSLTLLAFLAVIFVKLSMLNIFDFFKRVWLIMPIFVFIMSIPASTSLFIRSTPLFYIGDSLYISSIGLQIIVKMALRIGVSISFAYLLIMTTQWSHITKALSVFKIPYLIITILNMAYRYIFVLSEIAVQMMEARTLRTISEIKNNSNRSFIANRMSILFIKSSFISNEIYNAMRCRGFCDEIIKSITFKLKRIDYLWIINIVVIFIVLLMGELIH